MERRYLAGLLTGFIAAFCIFGIFTGGLLLRMYNERQEPGKVASEAGLSAGTGEDGTGAAAAKAESLFYDKIKELNDKIDVYYYDSADEGELYEGAYRGLVESLGDPYSGYYSEEEYADFLESASGTYSGIGATVSRDVETGTCYIVKPFVGGPAYKAGILPGDIIYKVSGEDVTGLDLSEVVTKMRGPEKTVVNVVIYREDGAKQHEFAITRETIEVPTVEHEMLEGQIGYISILEFDSVTTDQFIAAVDELEKDKMKALVIDLRNNPGGLFDACVAMLDRLLPKGVVVYTEDKYGNKRNSYAEDEEEFMLPLAVIVNGNSASASEIFAGAVQDYEKGTIIGTQSFGKGIVQSIIPLDIDNSAVKLTIYNYFTPNGNKVHGEGITPDIVVELDEGLDRLVTIPHDKDNQLQRAIEELMKGL